VHRAAAQGADLEIIEVQRGDWLSEDDIERLADDFGRVISGG
jgi:mannose-6-phosphate isomerase-like protein (cupin superfamily)